MVCVGLQQFAEFAAFFSVPASSRKFRLLATNQKVGSSNLSGRAIPFRCNDLRLMEKLPTFLVLTRRSGVRISRVSHMSQAAHLFCHLVTSRHGLVVFRSSSIVTEL